MYEGNTLLGEVTVGHRERDPYSMGSLDVDLSPGYHTLTLDYSGDENYRPDRRTMAVDIPNAQITLRSPDRP
ncbi:hypothetical protein [Parafrankia discariae]|uniref:hypothetical protein n=1 Tax=Parafrankia discariae TaxID=365528 RepID=UPI00036A11AC|nr:hypothetical protein [Parafrankia discariae]